MYNICPVCNVKSFCYHISKLHPLNIEICSHVEPFLDNYDVMRATIKTGERRLVLSYGMKTIKIDRKCSNGDYLYTCWGGGSCALAFATAAACCCCCCCCRAVGCRTGGGRGGISRVLLCASLFSHKVFSSCYK